MENKYVKCILKIVRIFLPAAALALCFHPAGFRNPQLDPDTLATVGYQYVSYFSRAVVDNANWLPLICALLCIGTIVMAFVCAFWEKEQTLTWLTGAFGLALCVNLLILMLYDLTAIGWCITGLLAVGLALTACQEIRMEQKNMK